jgi:2-amino-4-hydroxy-6-hydroxymethyldihydropteridine diphosphokinase
MGQDVPVVHPAFSVCEGIVAEQTVFLALGTNLGDRLQNLNEALERLAPYVTVEAVSQVYETAPAYVLDQPRFLNAALRGRTSLAPFELLDTLKRIEQDVGRVEGIRYGPRMLDLDILLYADQVIDTPRLKVPHERMAERAFVLVPLAELAADLVPPQWQETIKQAAERELAQSEPMHAVAYLTLTQP